jgi:hypothetical protein
MASLEIGIGSLETGVDRFESGGQWISDHHVINRMVGNNFDANVKYLGSFERNWFVQGGEIEGGDRCLIGLIALRADLPLIG